MAGCQLACIVLQRTDWENECPVRTKGPLLTARLVSGGPEASKCFTGLSVFTENRDKLPRDSLRFSRAPTKAGDLIIGGRHWGVE